jgi:hypothetical protein
MSRSRTPAAELKLHSDTRFALRQSQALVPADRFLAQ